MAPAQPDRACQKIRDELGIDCMVVDANDISVQILGTNREIGYDRTTLAKLIGDNPSGQGRQQTPFILVREAVRPKPVATLRLGAEKRAARPGKAAKPRSV